LWRFFTLKKIHFVLLLIALLCAAAALPAQTLSVDKPSLNFSAQVGGATQSASLNVLTSSGTAQFTTFPNTPWLTVNPTSGTAPSALTITVNPSGLATGVYQGTLSIFGPTNRVDVGVTLAISNVSVSPASLTFPYQVGAQAPQSQTLTLSGQAVNFTALATTAAGGQWLSVSPATGSFPGQLTVSLNQAVLISLAPNTYNGTISIQPAGQVNPVTIPVTLQVTAAPAVTISPASVSLYYQLNGSNNNAQQSITLSTPTGSQPVTFTVTPSVQPNPSGTTWFNVLPGLTGTIPSTGSTQLTFSYNGAQLPAGTYTGSALISTPGGSPASQQVPIQLVVSGSPLLSATAGALSFSYQVGTASPVAQNLTINSTAGASSLTLAANTNNTGNWLSVPATATAGTAFPVNINPSGLAPGSYTGTITVTSPGAANSPLQVAVNLKVTNDAVVVVSANGCSTATLTCSLLFPVQTGQAPPPAQTVTVGSSTASPLAYAATASSSECGGNWLVLSGATQGQTNAITNAFTVSVNATGVAAGSKCNGTVSIAATNPANNNAAAPNSPLNLNVTMYVSNSALAVVTPSALTFSTQVNGATPPQQAITVASTSTTDALTYTVTPSTQSGSNWLFVNSLGGTTGPNGSVISVTTVPGLLSPGTYSGSVTITATGPGGAAVADSPITVPIVFQVSSGTIAADKASLNFTQLTGGTAPAAQTVNLTGTPGAINFVVAATTDDGAQWLTATPASGTTPAAIQVQAAAASGMKSGTYTGKVTITAATPPGASGSPITIPVSFKLTDSATLTASPASPTFNFVIGQPAPAGQKVTVSSTGGASPFTVTVPSSVTWLTVTPASGTTPADLTFTVNATGLQPGKYAAGVTINSTAALQPAMVNVTLNVAAAVPPVLTAIANAASYTPGAISPGENIVIGGTGLGPDTLVSAQLTANGSFPTTVSDTMVTFDGIQAPIIYASAKQTSVMVPYEIAGRPSTQVRISYKGVQSDPLTYNVLPAVPGIYTQNSSGTGPGSILNENFSVNSAATPAAKGSVVAIYMTGEGVTSPNSTTGAVAPINGSGLNKPVLAPVTATVAGIPADVTYYGSAPGIIYGVMQVNVRIPANAPSLAQPIVISVGGNQTQAGVTVAIQ
jgi:trimeric autotransporter adhesin